MVQGWNEAAPLLEDFMLALVPSRDALTWRLMATAERGVPMLEVWCGPFAAVPHALRDLAQQRRHGPVRPGPADS